MKKRWLILPAVLVLAFALCIPNAVFRPVSGAVQEARRLILAHSEARVYAPYQKLFPTPEVENGYVPQGICRLEAEALCLISAYHESEPAVLIAVDAASGARIKTLRLQRPDGTPLDSHVGGVATDGQWIYLADGQRIARVSVSAMQQTADGGSLEIADEMQTDLRCAFLSCDGKYLYAGEFYNFSFDGKYKTDPAHWQTVTFFERYYARGCAYPLSALDAAFGAETVAVPEYVLTLPRCVQGFARAADGSICLSTSFGRNNNSFLLTYADVTAWDADGSVAYGDTRVPLYYLHQKALIGRTELPPMLEGIAAADGQLIGVFESCAAKYADGAFPLDAVCSFSVNNQNQEA